MTQLKFENCIIQLYQQLFGYKPDASVSREIAEIIADNGLDSHCPDWLLELFSAVIEDRNYKNRNIKFEELNSKHYDVSNFLAELNIVANIPMKDDGEYCVISLDSMGRSICLDKETTDGGVAIRVMRWPKKSGPHWDRR